VSRHHFDLKLLGKLSQCCASKSLKKYLKLVLGKKIGIPGGESNSDLRRLCPLALSSSRFGGRWPFFTERLFFRHAEGGYPSAFRNFPSLCPEDAEKGGAPEYPQSK
jgi:hypothetical protein